MSRDTRIGEIPSPLPVAAGAGNVTVASQAGALLGYSARETAGAAASLRLHDGTASTGQWLALINLAANESVRDWFGPQGVGVASGIWLERVSGQCELTVFEG